MIILNKQDLRVIKTKKAIHSAFLELIAEVGYQNITVKDIADRAMINRKTFYAHYDTKENLYNEITEKLLAIIFPVNMLAEFKSNNPKHQQRNLLAFLNNVKSVDDKCRIMLDDKTNTAFAENLRKRLEEAILYKEDILQRMDNDYVTFELLVDVYFSTFRLVLRWWLDGTQDPSRFMEMVRMLFSSKPLEMLGLNEEAFNDYSNLH